MKTRSSAKMQRKAFHDGSARSVQPPKGNKAQAPREPYAVSIDSIADASLQTHQTARGATATHCDICDAPIEGEPAGHGLYMWSRGGERRFEEPALCDNCSGGIGVSALNVWRVEEEG